VGMATYHVQTRAGWLAADSLTELSVLNAGALDAGGEPRRWRVRDRRGTTGVLPDELASSICWASRAVMDGMRMSRPSWYFAGGPHLTIRP
jgi:hypothetical protein